MACCGSDRCTCSLVAGPGVTIDGGGGTGNPWIISAPGAGGAVDCAQVRPCLSAGPGATYDPATGVIGADVSNTPGNNLSIDGGGLFVPPPAAPVTGCGLDGAGTAADPLVAAVAAWPFPCDIATSGSGVYCDPASGELRADPRYWADFEGGQAITSYVASPITVPVARTVIETISINVTNPDPCRNGLGLLFREVDLDFTLPPNSGAAAGIDDDEMNYFGNTGSGTIFATHSQDNKITVFTLNPGETRTITMNVEASRGSGGATITRVQKSLRAYVWSNHFV